MWSWSGAETLSIRPRIYSLRSNTTPRRRFSRPTYDPSDYDVFGDESVKILFTPGHTPGSQSLEVRLKQSGPVILDLGTFIKPAQYNRKYRRVPTENTAVPNL